MTERRFKHDPDEMWWLADANCIGEDPELFFPVGTSTLALDQTDMREGRLRRVPRPCRLPRVVARRPARTRASGAASTRRSAARSAGRGAAAPWSPPRELIAV